jgi:hypothetical protein
MKRTASRRNKSITDEYNDRYCTDATNPIEATDCRRSATETAKKPTTSDDKASYQWPRERFSLDPPIGVLEVAVWRAVCGS